MDFHHVLPSNTSPNYFPNNTASQYSTPVNNPYVLNGEWEVALIDATYSSCINTFNNDKMTIKEERTLTEFLAAQKDRPAVKVFLPVFPNTHTASLARTHYAVYISKMFETLLSVTLDGRFATWNLLTDDYYFIMSPQLQELFQLWSDVLTKMDAQFKNPRAFWEKPIPTTAFIIVVPIKSSSSVSRVDITLKKAEKPEKKRKSEEPEKKKKPEESEKKKTEEKMTVKELQRLFNTKVPSNIASLFTISDTHLGLLKKANDDNLIILNKALRRVLTFMNSGMYHKGKQQYVSVWFGELDKAWVVSILTLKKMVTYQRETTRDIILPPCSFTRESDATHFVNQTINDTRIAFTCDTNKHVNLYIGSKALTVTFDDTLRDIFAFDKNSYSGLKTTIASGIFSLCRRIQYLYIYSNLTDFIRVGNTESPLLAIMPLSYNNECNLLNERIFKQPMYIRVSRDRISQIDIAIYDGAGQLVPFVHDAITTLHLHFRQSQFMQS